MAIFALPEALYLVLKPPRDNSNNGEIKDLRITAREGLGKFVPVFEAVSLI